MYIHTNYTMMIKIMNIVITVTVSLTVTVIATVVTLLLLIMINNNNKWVALQALCVETGGAWRSWYVYDTILCCAVLYLCDHGMYTILYCAVLCTILYRRRRMALAPAIAVAFHYRTVVYTAAWYLIAHYGLLLNAIRFTVFCTESQRGLISIDSTSSIIMMIVITTIVVIMITLYTQYDILYDYGRILYCMINNSNTHTHDKLYTITYTHMCILTDLY